MDMNRAEYRNLQSQAKTAAPQSRVVVLGGPGMGNLLVVTSICFSTSNLSSRGDNEACRHVPGDALGKGSGTIGEQGTIITAFGDDTYLSHIDFQFQGVIR